MRTFSRVGAEEDTPNIALVRAAFVAFNNRDADALVEMMDPSGELYPYAIEKARAQGYQGPDGVRQYIADVESLFEDFQVDLDHFSEAADDVVYVRGRLKGRTRDAREVDLPVGWLWTVRDGKLLRMQADPRGRAV